MTTRAMTARARVHLRTFVAAGLMSLVTLPFASAGCDEFVYDSPPRPEIEGLVDNTLKNPFAPIVLTFSEPVDSSTLHVRLVSLQLDDEGNLGDEDDDKTTQNVQLVEFNGETGEASGATASLSDDRRRLTITLDAAPPIGPSLALLIEPGLADEVGNATAVRQRLVFAYSLDCPEGGAPTTFPSGYYFIVADITEPLGVQIQLLAYIEVDAVTGLLVGQFTNADRNPDGSRCSPACSAADACQTIPTEACVIPSTKVGSENEYPDFIGNATGETGFTFRVEGCAIDTPSGSVFINKPADIDITNPDVFVEGIKLSASFSEVDGAYRGTGVSGADNVFLGTNPAGSARGTMVGRLIPAGEDPIGVPKPAL